jgi:hypothetical protein
MTWCMWSGLPEILNHNEQWTQILGSYMYSKLPAWRRTYCSHGWLNSLSHTILHSHCNKIFNISTVVMLGFWLCQFNTGSLVWGLCSSWTTKFFVWLNQFNVCSLCYGWWCLCQFKISRWGYIFLFVSVSLFFVPHFGLSACHLKCTKHMGCNIDVVQWRIYVRTEDRWAKGIMWEGAIQAVVKMVINTPVL